jgi:hypothetical protein
MSRDDFTKSTIDILAKRVGYLCSNPNCKKPTIGAHEQKDKSTSIGIAAHITAASPGGPRYDDTLTIEQRKNIDNGIWLCSNCATLIDKDKEKYKIDLIKDWKIKAEIDSKLRLIGELKNQDTNNPYLEVDLIYKSGMRLNNGYSFKNPSTIENGIRIFDVNHFPIIHWRLIWKFNLTIHNNSLSPAYNVQIEELGDIKFSQMDNLPKINNIPQFEKIDLRANYETQLESDYREADRIYKTKIPEDFEKLQLKLSYQDNNRETHFTIVEFKNDDIQNYKQ